MDRDEIFRFLRATARPGSAESRETREKRIKGVGWGGRGGKRAQKGAERDEEGIRVAASQRGALPRGPRSFSFIDLFVLYRSMLYGFTVPTL